MKSKVIFLDIDGTIALGADKVSDRVIEAIQQARNNGHYVLICTGRNKVGAEFLQHIGFDGIISSAGGYVEVVGQPIFESYLSEADVKEARCAFDECGVLYNLESTMSTYADQRIVELYIMGHFDFQEMNSEMQRIINEQKQEMNLKSMLEYDQNPEPIHKISFIALNKESLENVQKRLSYKYKFVVHDLFSTDTINGEIIINGIDKGKAVQKVVQHLGMSMEDTICFGDSLNDLEMLQACHHSVAMGNAVDELKAVATTICESVYDDGVYHEFKRLKLI